MPREISSKGGRKFTYVGLLWLGAAAIAATGVHASELGKTADDKSKVEQITSATNGGSVRVAMDHSYLGSAPYICTPSGYGNQARCFLRAGVHSHR